MITHLSIRNYALIDSLELDFAPNLTTITGETGSGKSILLGALGLILGERADTTSLKDTAQKCIIEGVFQLEDYARNYQVNDFFSRYELDYEDLTTIRREITSSGRSRTFVNDTPVNLQQLRELTTQLVDIHSQHETLHLNQAHFQRNVLDIYAGNDSLLKKYTTTYQEWVSLTKELADLTEREENAKKDLDYFQFQYDELEKLSLKAGEEKELERELETLSNAESIQSNLRAVVELINEKEDNVVEQMNTIKRQITSVASYFEDGEQLTQRLESCYAELNDIAADLDDKAQAVSMDPKRLAVVEERLDKVNGLLVKHRMQTTEELLAFQTELETKIQGIGSLEEQLEKTQKQLEVSYTLLLEHGKKLSVSRNKSIAPLCKAIKSILEQLAMPNADLEVRMEPLEVPANHGVDHIGFYFKANKGGTHNEIGKVASGGELSRLMLAIKSILAEVKTLPTVIFDEIDTGISGDVADKTGNILKQMAKSLQVIAITHLPQMASKGDQHWKVYKDSSGASTVTQVEVLDRNGRIDEIAKMLSGEALTDAARENARVLLD